MDFLGMWKFDCMVSRDDEGNKVLIGAEEYVNTLPAYIKTDNTEEVEHEKKQRQMFVSTVISVEEDAMYMLMPLPEGVSQEEIDAAVASGDVELKDGYMLIESHAIKVVDGVPYYDTHVQSSDPDFDPYTPLFDKEGNFSLMGTRYVKM